MFVYTSTVIRESDSALSGFLILIDWTRKRIIKKIPLPINTGHKYWNARGGNRGGRGIQFDRNNSLLYVATATEILKYSLDLDYLGALNHEYMAGLHEILLDENSLWIISTVHDLVFRLGLDGELQDEWWGSKSTVLRESFFHEERNINIRLQFPEVGFEQAYEKYCSEEVFHLNAVATYNESTYVLSNFKNSVIKIRPTEEVVFSDSSLCYPHNLYISAEGQIVLNDTGNQRLRVYDVKTGMLLQTVDTPVTCNGESSVQFAKAGWQRGLSVLDTDRYLVGTSPAQIFEIDSSNAEIKGRMIIDKNIRHCIHGLLAVDL